MKGKNIWSNHEHPDRVLEMWRARFDVIVGGRGHSSRSWKRLTELKLDMDRVALLLFLSSDFEGAPGYAILSWIKGLLAPQGKEAARLSKRLREDADALGAFGVEAQFKAIITQLDELSEALKAKSRDVQVFTSKRVLNPTVFRAWLIRYVKDSAKTPLYAELSHLLDAAYEAHNEEPPAFGPDALRKAYARFVANPSQVGFPSDWALPILFALMFLKLSSVSIWAPGTVDYPPPDENALDF